MNKKLSLIDEPAHKPDGPTFRQKSAKAARSAVKSVGMGLGKVLLNGWFWTATVVSGGAWGISGLIKEDNREQAAFEQRMEKVLIDDGYKILATDRYTVDEHQHSPSQRLKFPKDFERAAVITAEKNTNIYDFAVVRKVASKSGYEHEKIIDKKFFDRTGPGLKK